jgi:hypothetical protein
VDELREYLFLQKESFSCRCVVLCDIFFKKCKSPVNCCCNLGQFYTLFICCELGCVKIYTLHLWDLKLLLPWRLISWCSGFSAMLYSGKWVPSFWRNKRHILPPKCWSPPTGLQYGVRNRWAILWHFSCLGDKQVMCIEVGNTHAPSVVLQALSVLGVVYYIQHFLRYR